MRKTTKEKSLKKSEKTQLIQSLDNINYYEISLLMIPEIKEHFKAILSDSAFYYEHIKEKLIQPIFGLLDAIIDTLISEKTELKEKKIKLIKNSEIYTNFKANIFAKHHREVIGEVKIYDLPDKYFLNITKLTTFYSYLKELILSIVRTGSEFSKLDELKWLCWRIERMLRLEIEEVKGV